MTDRQKAIVLVESQNETFAICGNTDRGVDLAKDYGAPLRAKEISLLMAARGGQPLESESVVALAAIKRVFPHSEIVHSLNMRQWRKHGKYGNQPTARTTRSAPEKHRQHGGETSG